MKTKILFLLLLFSFFISCSKSEANINHHSIVTTDDSDGDSDEDSGGNSSWLIPINQVLDGGPGKDGIPSINSPLFIDANHPDASYISDTDLVVGIVKNNIAKAYSHIVLDWHEIINDQFETESITISYCPLTGTAFAWKSVADLEVTTFGVSGLLYNANLILYDRKTDSNWSQLKLQCVNGTLIGDEPTLDPVVETTWGLWKKLYPNTKLLSLDTGFSRNYGTYPYGPYRTNHEFFIFPASPTNPELPNKERVYTIIDIDKSKVYRFPDFASGNVIKDVFQGKTYVIAGNENVINAFELNEAQLNLEFNYSFNDLETFFTDDEGNHWSIFGKALSGPREGETLKAAKSVVSYWFAIAAFYPNPHIYPE